MSFEAYPGETLGMVMNNGKIEEIGPGLPDLGSSLQHVLRPGDVEVRHDVFVEIQPPLIPAVDVAVRQRRQHERQGRG